MSGYGTTEVVDDDAQSALMRIDLHAHVVPPAILNARDSGVVPGMALPTAEGLLDAMDAYAIDATVMSVPFDSSYLGSSDVRMLARAVNDGHAEAVRGAPRRLGAVASLPISDPDGALEELAYSLDELGLDGVVLPTSHAGTYLGDPSWDWLFDELERRRCYVFVHPIADAFDPLKRFFGSWLVEMPFETTRAVMNLIFSGTFDRCPNVRFQFAHMGGAAPYLAPRLEELYARYGDEARDAAPGGLAYLERAYWDTGLSGGRGTIDAVLAVSGIEQIVFGTDWPADTARPKVGGDPMPILNDLGEEWRRKVEAENPARLVPRLAAAAAAPPTEV